MTVDVMDELMSAGALMRDGHFVYTSGKHGNGYANMDMLFPRVEVVSQLCELLVAPFAHDVETVAAPATGGIVLSTLAGDVLARQGRNVSSVWADKKNDGFVFERGDFVDRLRGKRVLVVEDLLNTGGSVEKVCRAAEGHGAQVIGVSVVGSYGTATAEHLQVPRMEALVDIDFTVEPEESCSLCGQQVPIVSDVGHGGKYQAEHPDYLGGYVKRLRF